MEGWNNVNLTNTFKHVNYNILEKGVIYNSDIFKKLLGRTLTSLCNKYLHSIGISK